MKSKYLALVLVSIAWVAYFSIWNAKVINNNNDFPAFYRAACIILDDEKIISDLYIISEQDYMKYQLPNEYITAYRYSVIAAYLMSPLALFDYESANALFIFINIMAYLISVALVLRVSRAKGMSIWVFLALSLFWMPFLQNIRWSQINSILLLLLTISVIEAREDRYILAGMLLSVGSLFKPVLLPVLMVLSLKNWRIWIGFVPIAVSLVFLPGTREWFHSFLWPPHNASCYNAFYSFLNANNSYLFYIYAVSFGAISALFTYKYRQADYFVVGSFAAPAALLSMPILEIHYPTLLIFCFAYLSTQKLNIIIKLLSVSSFVMIWAGSSHSFWAPQVLVGKASIICYLGILLLWAALVIMLKERSKTDVDKI